MLRTASACWCALVLAVPVASGKPLGYERFTDLNVETGVFTELTPSEVYDQYARQLTLGPGLGKGVRDKRLIDVETHHDDDGKLTLSGIWIENAGEHQLESWLVLDVRYGDLANYHELWKEIIPLDIERYDNKKGDLRYAIIFQRNTHQSHWYFKPDMSEAQLWFDFPAYRWVDIDRYWSIGDDNGQAVVAKDTFDAIMVEQSGMNFVPTQWVLLNNSPDATSVDGLPYQLTYWKAGGWQAVDLIDTTALVVHSGRDFAVGGSQTSMEASLNPWLYGRAVDLEGGPSGFPDLPFPNGVVYENSNWRTVFCGSL